MTLNTREILWGAVKFIATPFVALVFAIAIQGKLSAAQAALVLYYPFDGNANDASGFGRDGMVVGATLAADRFGNPNSSYHFSGGDYIRAAADGLPTGERTTALWFRTDDLSTRPVMLGYGGGICGTSWIMDVDSGGSATFEMGSHCGGPGIVYNYQSPPVGAWTHFAVTTDPSGLRLYIDGVLRAENTTFVNDTTVTGTDLGIGVAPSPGGVVPYTDVNIGYFLGELDDVRIYDRALTANEIRTLAGVGVVGSGTAASCTDAALNTALSGGGLVTFNCGPAPLTIDISSAGGGTGTKIISTDTTIDGGGLITISGGNSVGVFAVSAGVTFTVQNLTIANGNSGGGSGIVTTGSGGTLIVTNSTFSGNSAGSFGGGIFNGSGGTVTVTNSTFSGNGAGDGGGIAQGAGTLTVTKSTFSGNSAHFGGSGTAEGGGIFNAGGTVTVTNSTFSGNSADSAGFGGGIVNGSSGTLTVSNSTFFGNSAGRSGFGGGIENGSGGTLTVSNSTFSGNSAGTGGGVAQLSIRGGTLTNTIVANSTSGDNCAGSVTDGGHNVDDGTTCGFTGTSCASTTGSSFCSTNPQLDPAGLASNGGPTQTIALQSGSPAIDSGDDAVCAAPPVNNLDQRGFTRSGTGHTHCSIGAYEATGCTRLPSGLVSWYRGEGNARDSIGNNNGTLSQSGVTFVPGEVGQAFHFTGNQGKVEIPDDPSLRPSAISVEAWIKPNFNSRPRFADDIDTVLAKFPDYVFAVVQDPNSTYGGTLPGGVPKGTIVFERTNGAGLDLVLSAAQIPDDGFFHHVAGTYDGTSLKVYIDGVLRGTMPSTGDIVGTAAVARIGFEGAQPRDSVADIDEVSMYNRALSDSEIQAVFAAGSAGKCNLLTVHGTCMEPGPQGLVPCTAGTVVTAYLCTDQSCAASTLSTLEVTQTDANGQFIFVLDGGQVAGKRLVFDATIVQAARAASTRGAASTLVDYQIIDFGPVGNVSSLSVTIDPVSEAAVRLVGETGAQHYTDQGIMDAIEAVRTADKDIDFGGASAADAAALATATARNDPMVQTALTVQFCTGDCNTDHAVKLDEILTIMDIALGNADVADCSVGDGNNDRTVTIDEIVTAVNNAVSGACTQ